MKYLIILSLLLSTIVHSKSDPKDMAHSREWLTLMHYKKVLLGYKSEVDGEKFFMAKEGKRNPLKELETNLENFKRTGLPEDDLHPQCVFPARYQFFKKNFNLSVTEVKCPQYTWWRENIPFKSASVIFASYYAGNPASIYGHTFLRINSSEGRNISDYGLDFSAITTTDHGVEFALRGLFGGYTGLFSLKPYYIKLNDYIENESRDLWEYDLNLSVEQIDTMLAHLWELLRYGQFDYFFLDENCSYQILTLLEVANPKLHLSEEFFWKAIPIDTVKKIVESGAVQEIHYRPAYKKTVLQKLGRLNKDERRQMDEIVHFKSKFEDVRSVKVIEAAAAHLRYERFEEKKFTMEQQKLLRDLLLYRAKMGGVVEKEEVLNAREIKAIRPDRSHDSEKYSLALGNNTKLDTYAELSARASLNDLLELDRGYPKHSLIETAHLKLRYTPEHKRLFFQEMKYAEAISLFPLDGNEFKWSWRAGGKSYRVYDGSCKDCVSHQLKSGGGVATNLGFIDMTVYSLVLMNAEISKGFYRGYRVAPAVDLGAVWTVKENFKLHYDFEIDRDLNRANQYRDLRLMHQLGLAWNYRTQQEWRLNATSWDSLSGQNPVEEIQLNYSFYY